jgi:hypothetical protein
VPLGVVPGPDGEEHGVVTFGGDNMARVVIVVWVLSAVGFGALAVASLRRGEGACRRALLVLALVAVWGSVAFGYWRQRAETADARTCARWAQTTMASYQRALLAGQPSEAAAALTRDKRAACDRFNRHNERP